MLQCYFYVRLVTRQVANSAFTQNIRVSHFAGFSSPGSFRRVRLSGIAVGPRSTLATCTTATAITAAVDRPTGASSTGWPTGVYVVCTADSVVTPSTFRVHSTRVHVHSRDKNLGQNFGGYTCPLCPMPATCLRKDGLPLINRG